MGYGLECNRTRGACHDAGTTAGRDQFRAAAAVSTGPVGRPLRAAPSAPPRAAPAAAGGQPSLRGHIAGALRKAARKITP